ncbi:MAG TPA: hypothetical protein VHX62_10690 [Solirubrobacteraceae bacterium]|nr:hypothetical protein [Solirubrobacteraceae bacterium]
MSEFEDNLWQEIVRTHGRELAAVPSPVAGRERGGAHRRWARPRVLAGTSAGLVAAATVAVVLVLSATASSPAYAVSRNADGTVTVKLVRFSGIAAANHTLATMGVRAKIVQALVMAHSVVAARPCQGKRAGSVRTLTFVPASIPPRQVLLLAADGAAHLSYAMPPVKPAATRPVGVPAPSAAVVPAPAHLKAAAIAIQRARILATQAAAVAALKPATVRTVRVTPITVGTVAPAKARQLHQIKVYCGPVAGPPMPIPAGTK